MKDKNRIKKIKVIGGKGLTKIKVNDNITAEANSSRQQADTYGFLPVSDAAWQPQQKNSRIIDNSFMHSGIQPQHEHNLFMLDRELSLLCP